MFCTPVYRCDDDRESLAATAAALRRENGSLRRSVEQLERKKRDAERQVRCVEQLMTQDVERQVEQVMTQDADRQVRCVEQLMTRARELRDENSALIRDFRSLKDSIAVEREHDAAEIRELTAAFRQLIAGNELLRQKNGELTGRMRQLERATSVGEEQEHIADSADDSSWALNEPASSVNVAGEEEREERRAEEVGRRLATQSREKSACRETQTDWDDVARFDERSGVLADAETHGGGGVSVAQLVADIRRKDDEIGRLHANVARMDRILGDMTKAPAAAPADDKAEAEAACQLWEPLDCRQPAAATSAANTTEKGVVDERSPTGTEEKRGGGGEEATSEKFPRLAECSGGGETASAAAAGWRASRQTSADSGVSRGLADSGAQPSWPPRSEGTPARDAADPAAGLSAAWKQLVAENDRLRRELAAAAAPWSKTDENHRQDESSDGEEESGTTTSLRRRAAQLEWEVTALKRTVREQSIYLGGAAGVAVRPDDVDVDWAQPYDCNLNVDGEESDRQKNDSDATVGVLRRENALMKEELRAMGMKCNSQEEELKAMKMKCKVSQEDELRAAEMKRNSRHEVCADETRDDRLHVEEAARLRDRQTALLDELASKTKQIQDLEQLGRRHQRATDEIADSYFAIFDEVDSRRTRLNDDGNDFSSGDDGNNERTMQAFGVRLERWLNDYEMLIGERNVQRLSGDVLPFWAQEKNQIPDTGDVAREHQSDYESPLIDFSTQPESVGHDFIVLQQTQMTDIQEAPGVEVTENELDAKNQEEADELPIETAASEQARPTSDALAGNLERLEAELSAKKKELRRKNEEVDQMRVENEALKSAASSSSADYEEQIDRLAFDRSVLQQRLQEAQFDAEEAREELGGENDRLCRRLEATRRRADDDRAAADLLAADNRRLRDDLAGLESTHRAQLDDWAERARETEDRARTEAGRLEGELAAVAEERDGLRDSCAKLESDCLAFQELSSEMVERCERLTIDLERLRRRRDTHGAGSDDDGGASCTFHAQHHEYCRRSAEQARREVAALRDENARLAMILEMERLKNFDAAAARPPAVDNDSQTDSDFEPYGGGGATQPSWTGSTTSADGGRRPEVDGKGGVASALLLEHAEAARVGASQLRQLLRPGGATVNGQKEEARGGGGVEEATASTHHHQQLADVVDELADELDAVVKSLTVGGGRTDDFTAHSNNLTTHDNQQPALV